VVFAPALPIAPTQAAQQKAAGEGHTLLALARGVLYGLDSRNGEVRWARRTSADAAGLPVRLPPTPLTHELALVLAGEQNILAAIDVESGLEVWRHALDSPCLAGPLVCAGRV